VPVALPAPNTGLRQPHEQTAWTAPSPSSWIVVAWSTAIGVLLVNDPQPLLVSWHDQLAAPVERFLLIKDMGRHRLTPARFDRRCPPRIA
jgi:hypothetical protein